MIYCQEWLMKQIELLEDYSFMEIGTRRWGNEPTHHKSYFPKAAKYVLTDFMDGKDVDVVADAHELSKVFGKESFDIIFAPSVFEHLERPWIAAEEILKTLKPGGLFWVQTHQTFPVHGFPNDYFRYTTEGLKVLFAKAAEVFTDYEFPCRIISDETNGEMQNKKSFINVVITGRK